MLYLPQPLLPDLDRALGTPPAVTGLVMTAALVGFAISGFLPEGRPERTLRLAMWLTVAASAAAVLSPAVAVLLAARVLQGVGVGLMIAGGLADVARRLPPAVAGRVTGALISGSAFGGLLGRLVGYTGNFLGWRGAFAVGGAGVLGVVYLSLGRLSAPSAGSPDPLPPRPGGSAPLSLLLAGGGILFVSVGMFDLLPYRLEAPPFRLPTASADLVYLVFVPAAAFGMLAGRAIDRFGVRAVILTIAAAGVGMLLVGLLPSVSALLVAALGAICGAVGLHVAHSGAAAAHGRAAVGRYLASYYVGGALAAPLLAALYDRWGWTPVIAALAASWLAVAGLAALRRAPHPLQSEPVPPPSPLG